MKVRIIQGLLLASIALLATLGGLAKTEQMLERQAIERAV